MAVLVHFVARYMYMPYMHSCVYGMHGIISVYVHIHTVEDKKTFPFDVLQNGTVCIVVRCVLRNGIN